MSSLDGSENIISKGKMKELLSLQLKAEDFLPADDSEKEYAQEGVRSEGFYRDGLRRFSKNRSAVFAFTLVVIIIIAAYIVPEFYPYAYEQQMKGSERLSPMEYSSDELSRIEAGEKVFPHLLGTDINGRDYMIRVLMGTRISMSVGIVAALLILLIGATYGAISGYFGGRIDMFMMRIVDMIYTVPDVLIIILLAQVLKYPLGDLADKPGFEWLLDIGPNMVSMFIVFALLYWVGMARIVRGQIMLLKENEYVTAARTLGAGHAYIIFRHLIPNCIGTLIVTTTMEIPSAIFTESFLSFLGIEVEAPMPSLGSLAANGLNGMNAYPEKLFVPAFMIFIIIFSFNLLGDGLRDAFDPRNHR